MSTGGHDVQALGFARARFGRGQAAHKLDLLARCGRLSLVRPRLIRDYHDTLLFLAAYPDDARVRSVVEAELRRVSRAVSGLAAAGGTLEALRDTGICGTEVESSFTVDLVGWLVRRFPRGVEIAWDGDRAPGRGLDDLLTSCVSHVESDGLLGNRLPTREWVRLARGGRPGSDLAWLLQQLDRLRCSAEALDQVFDGLDLCIRWALDESTASSTFLRFPKRRIFYQSGALRRRFSARRLLDRPLPPPRRLGPRHRDEVLSVARASLVIRHRETDPVTYANRREITLFSLDRGIDVALLGMQPARRLPIESFFGYVAARNRVPIAYGGAWVFFDRAEVGINVFDTFRGGESSYLFAQVLRVYHHHYRVRRFVVDPFQIGADNTEGIRSGAFWFYYRLGFRPVDPELRRLARDEFARLRADRSHRTSASTLRSLASSELALSVGTKAEDVPDLTSIGLAVTTAVGEQFRGDRLEAEEWAGRRVRRLLGVRGTGRWPAPERDAFDRLSLLMALIPGVGEWSAVEKRALVSLMRAKGGQREREYLRSLQRHQRLRSSLAALACSIA